MDMSPNYPFPNLPRTTNPKFQSSFNSPQASVTTPAPQPAVTNSTLELPVPVCASNPPPTLPQTSVTVPRNSVPPPLSSSPLPAYILANTTIHISLSTNSYGAVPLLLRDCATLDAFFDAILAAWVIEEGDIRAVVVRFDWLEDKKGGKEGTGMVLRRSVRGCWDVFLRVVGEAECWKEDGDRKGRGDVRVEVIVK